MGKRRQAPPPNDRLSTTTVGDLRVTAAVPSAVETKEIFGVKLYNKNIQPVWVKLENLSDRYLWFLPFGLDPAYFTPLEAAYRNHSKSPKKNENLNRDVP